MKFICITIFLFLSLNVKADLIDNATIISMTVSSAHNNDYVTYGPNSVIDGHLNTAWATNRENRGAWIEFDFGTAKLISEVWFTDRIAVMDNTIRYNLIFTNENITKVQEVFSPYYANTEKISINNGSGFYARYLRFEVTDAGEYLPPTDHNVNYSIGRKTANVGAREFSFIVHQQPLKYQNLRLLLYSH